MGHTECMTCNATASASSKHLVGWVFDPSGRGTFGVIETCLGTIALCTWVVIHPRIDRRATVRLCHKLALFLKAVIAPEFIAVEAAQEWRQARRIVQESARYTNGELHMEHAFYIGMFGIRYRTEHGTKLLWPNQFVWLLEQGLCDWRIQDEWDLALEIIEDKSKADATAKLFALLQSAWFVAQSIMRAAHRLPLAPLESMTLGYIPLFAVTYFFWWLKPKDIETPSIVVLPHMSTTQRRSFDLMSLCDDYDEEGTAKQSSLWQVWYLTPRWFEKDYEERKMQKADQDYDMAIQAYQEHRGSCAVVNCAECERLEPSPPTHDEETVLSHWDPDLYHSKLWPITCLVGISFGALHLSSWDTTFPTFVETWLWRAAAISSMATMLVFMQFEMVIVDWKDPLMFIKILAPALYLLSRLVMLAGAIAAFRASEPAIYDTYDVSNYWIHLL